MRDRLRRMIDHYAALPTLAGLAALAVYAALLLLAR